MASRYATTQARKLTSQVHMTNISVFEFESEEIRFINGKPVANDVAKTLGYLDPVNTVRKRVEPENKGVDKMATPGGIQSVTVLEEAGIYQLIFGSKLPSAKVFQQWVFSEVLPAIRKTGKYETAPEVVEKLPSRVIALETAKSVFEIKDMLADSDPRLCQMLVDVAINDAMAVIKAIAPASETKWMGAVEIAESLKLPVTTQNRTTLGKFVKATCGNLGKQEERICNGRMMPIWCYPMPNKEVEAAVRKFFD